MRALIGELPGPVQFIIYYYLSTPLFMLVDIIFGWHIRIPFFENDLFEWIYYAGLFVCAVVCYLSPGASPFITLFESSLNFLLLLLGIILPIVMMPGELLAGETINTETVQSFNTNVIFNFIFIGLILVFSIQTSIKNIHGRLFNV